MDNIKLSRVFKTSFVVVVILTIIFCLSLLIGLVKYPPKDDILDFGLGVDIVLECMAHSVFLASEYGIYSGLKYLIFEKQKRITLFIWAIVKTTGSLYVWIYIFNAIISFSR